MKTQNSIQFRVRVNPATAKRFLGLPPRLRSRAVAMILDAHAEGINLKELVSFRNELRNLGTLMNQSLQTTWAQETNPVAANEVVKLLGKMVR